MNNMRIALPQMRFEERAASSTTDGENSVLSECNRNLVEDIKRIKDCGRTDNIDELPRLSHINTGDFIAADLIGAKQLLSRDSTSSCLSSTSGGLTTPLPFPFTPRPPQESRVLPTRGESISDICSVGSERATPPFITAMPLGTTNLPQRDITAEVARKVQEASQVATNSFFLNSTTDIFTNLNSRIQALQGDDYPSALRSCQLNGGKSLTQGAVHLRGYINESENIVYLNFSGVSNTSLITDVKFILSSLRGRETSDMKNALAMVKTFQQAYPDKKIVLSGHSMGGAFSSYCSIKAGLPAVNFNGMGLTRRLINSLRHQHPHCNIIQINAHHDWLSQFVQKRILVQPGERFKVPGFSGHALYSQTKGEGKLMADEMYNTITGAV
ncbi:hypothetical protein ACQYE5_003033 [Enterobacter cancerogenus]